MKNKKRSNKKVDKTLKTAENDLTLNRESENTVTEVNESAVEEENINTPEITGGTEEFSSECLEDEKARKAEIKRLKKVVKAEKKELKKASKEEKTLQKKNSAEEKKAQKKNVAEEKKAQKKNASDEKRLLKENEKARAAENAELKKQQKNETKEKKKAEAQSKRAEKESAKAQKALRKENGVTEENTTPKVKKARKKLSSKGKKLIAAALAVIIAASGGAIWYFNPQIIPEKPDTSENALVPEISGAESVLADSYGNELFLNSESGAFYFKSKYSQNGLLNPFSGDAAAYGKAAAVCAELTNKYGEYIILNSTDNSLSFGSFETEKLKNGYLFTYTLFENSEAYESNKETGFAAQIPLKITVEGGNFKISSDLSEAKLGEGLVIEKLSLIPGAFAVDKNIEGNYYIVPDGSGCIVDLFSRPGEELSAEFPVYNADVTSGEYKDGALIPYYSFSDGNCLTTAVIDDGDALATVYYDTEIDGTSLLYSVFDITPTVRTERGTFFGTGYTGEASVVLNFQKDGNNAYNDAAFFVREFFVKKGYLGDSVIESTGDLPFIISVIGSADGNEETLYTTFEQAEEIVTLLNSKGVRSIWLRFTGGFSDGLLQSGGSYRTPDKMLGGSNGFIQLKNTADEKNSRLFLEADVLTGKAEKALGGGKVKAYTYSDLHSSTKSYSERKTLGANSVLRDNVSSLYKLSAELENCDISVNDISFLLYSGKGKTRQDALDEARSAATALSSESSLMLSHPALYLMKYATAVSGVPTSYTTLSGSGLHAIPFLQSVIHGSVIYGCDYVNNGDLWNTMLKTVEYGGVPSFLFTYEDCEGLAYGNYAAIAAQYYAKVKALKAVADMRITSHEEIRTGIYKTVYNYNRVVYVNYTGSVAEIEGVLLSPQDFLIV